MKCAVAALLLLGVVAVSAQLQVCDNKIKPGQVPSSGVKMVSTTNSGSFSDLKLEWNRPRDRTTPNGLDSCISSYSVGIVRGDGKVIQQADVSVSPAHTSAQYHAKGLNPGETYKLTVAAKGAGGTGPGNGFLGAFKTAPKTATPVPL